jgi:hypothetical protein
VINLDEWAEIRRLHRSEGMGIKAIARQVGVARNTVRAALSAGTPPKYERESPGSMVDAFEPQIRALLGKTPTMPASVVAERIGWEHSASVLRAKVAQLRPEFTPADPCDRTEYVAGEIVQCDLWFPPKIVPVWPGVATDPPILTMTATWSGFIMAMLIPTRTTGDLLAGMWQLLMGLGAVPKMLVWDNESGIGQHHRLTVPARSFAGTLGTRIYQTKARDPETKGVVERANGYFQTSFLPGRDFTDPADFNAQLKDWLPRCNQRILRRTGMAPGLRIGNDAAAMGDLPPVAPLVGTTDRVRLGRDYYVRVLGNDYSVDPSVIGRFVDVVAGIETVVVTCTGQVVATHQRCWDTHRNITDPAHVATAALMRKAYQARTAYRPAPIVAAGTQIGLRALSDYDDLFAVPAGPSTLPADQAGPAADLRIVR